MVKFISLGTNCCIGWQIKKFIDQPRFGFEWNRVYSLKKATDIYREIIDNSPKEKILSFLDNLTFVKESDKFPDFDSDHLGNVLIYKNNDFGLYHDFYPNITLDQVKDKYYKRLIRIKEYFNELLVFIRFEEKKNKVQENLNILSEFNQYLHSKKIYHKIIYITPVEINASDIEIVNYNPKEYTDWKYDFIDWEYILGIKRYRQYLNQDLRTDIDKELSDPVIILMMHKIKHLGFSECKIWKSKNDFMIKLKGDGDYSCLNDYCVIVNDTIVSEKKSIDIRFFDINNYCDIIIKYIPDTFTQSNIEISNEMYSYVARMSKGYKKISIYGRNYYHFAAFLEKNNSEVKGFTPCKLTLGYGGSLLNHQYDLLNDCDLLIISPGRQGCKFINEIKCKNVILISCNENRNGIWNYNIISMKKFNMFPGTGFNETVYELTYNRI